MTAFVTPTFNGRELPRNDWEGDDFTPGTGGKWVTCVDTAAGRMVAWATNGRINKDGKVYRAAIQPPDPNGLTLDQAASAVHIVTGLGMVRPNWNLRECRAQLQQGRGLVVTGPYAAIDRAYRFQDNADFSHALFIPYLVNAVSLLDFLEALDAHQIHVYNTRGLAVLLSQRILSPHQLHLLHQYNTQEPSSSMLVYDPLNPNKEGYGALVPQTAMWPFIAAGRYNVAYIPLEPL